MTKKGRDYRCRNLLFWRMRGFVAARRALPQPHAVADFLRGVARVVPVLLRHQSGSYDGRWDGWYRVRGVGISRKKHFRRDFP